MAQPSLGYQRTEPYHDAAGQSDEALQLLTTDYLLLGLRTQSADAIVF